MHQDRKDPRLNQVIYGRITVTGQQFSTKTKRKQKTITLSLTQPHTQKNPTHKHQAEATEHREKQLKNFKYLENASQSQYQ